MTSWTWLFVAAGGAGGSLGRYLLIHTMSGMAGGYYATLLINVIGCLCIGLLRGAMQEHLLLSPEWRDGLTIGLLGGFTTFSTFSYETLSLFLSGERLRAVIYILLSVFLCLIACAIGLYLGKGR